MKNKPTAQIRRCRAVPLLIVTGGLATAVPGLAQTAASYEGIEQGPPIGQYRFGLSTGYRTDADFDSAGGGKFSEYALRATGAGVFQLSDQVKLGGFGSYQFSHYDVSDLPVAGDYSADVHMMRITTLLDYSIDENWSVYGGPSLALAGADGADFSQAFTGGGLVGFNYKANDKLSVGGGLGVFSQLEENAKVLPFVTANWEFADQWNLHAGFLELAGNGGLGAEVTYTINEQWKVGGGVMYEKKRFRMKESLPGRAGDGVGQDRNVPIFAKLSWQPIKEATVEAIAGVVVGGQVRFEDNEGNYLYQSDYKASAVLGLQGTYRF